MLTGGRRRRRLTPRPVIAILTVVALAAGGTAYFVLVRHDRGAGGGGVVPLAAAPVHSGSVDRSPLLGRARTPRVRMPAPQLQFAKPPHAALLFDVESGKALGQYKPYKRLP